MKKELSPKQLMLIGLISWLLAKLPLGNVVGMALELGGIIAFIAGVIAFLKSRIQKKPQVQDKLTAQK